MLLRRYWFRRWMVFSPYRITAVCLFTLVFLSVWTLFVSLLGSIWNYTPVGPLTETYVQRGRGIGGRWHIPPSWIPQIDIVHTLTANSSILEAAECALELALQPHAFLNNSHIPLITHQTWSTSDADEWPAIIRQSVETWIRAAVQSEDGSLHRPEMAWFLWDDDGIDALIEKYEPNLYENFQRLPFSVEKADVFRVVVLKWFGGVYADVDSEPLKHPFGWIYESDLLPWVEASSNRSHTLHEPVMQAYAHISDGPASYQRIFSSETFNRHFLSQPSVNAIFGIGADNPPAPNPTYWRMGYTFPVQITNWALAMSPHHPISQQFINTLKSTIWQNLNDLTTVDPLDITGPPALTAAIRNIALQDEPDLSWDALSARNGDSKGGRGKIVAGDALILPITGFNPGRGWIQNMGSQSITHKNARLRHAAAGSWRNLSLKAHYGKLCRQLFGMCRHWKKVPEV